MKIRVAIVDDHPFIINGVKNVLSFFKHIEILATYSNGKALMQGLQKEQPDVLLLDIQLPDISGNDLIRTITKEYPEIRTIILTSIDNIYHVKDIIRNGAKGYILKSTDDSILIEAIEQVYDNKEYIDPVIKEQLLESVLHNKSSSNAKPELTRREKEILKLIIAEKTNQEIAEELFLSLRTVEHHRYSILHKLDAKNTVGLVKKAIDMGLIN
ncbi:MAG TPA: response regulator transcription factor [Candidatus Babeliaceae bacterium]|nr:response regulator transcription factor [Candidatus Babeliaceae bacterium]